MIYRNPLVRVAVTTKSHLIRDCIHHSIRLRLLYLHTIKINARYGDSGQQLIQKLSCCGIRDEMKLIRIKTASPAGHANRSSVVVQRFSCYTFFQVSGFWHCILHSCNRNEFSLSEAGLRVQYMYMLSPKRPHFYFLLNKRSKNFDKRPNRRQKIH